MLSGPSDIENAPMCLDEPWLTWADAWQDKKPRVISRIGVAYMLRGDAGVSNTDPYAEGPRQDNESVTTGPHLMLVIPDAAILEGITTNPKAVGPSSCGKARRTPMSWFPWPR